VKIQIININYMNKYKIYTYIFAKSYYTFKKFILELKLEKK